MKIALIISSILFFLSCNKQIYMDCEANSYYISPYKADNGFSSTQREVFTVFSEDDFNVLFEGGEMSCKEVLSKYFYCNICFNNDLNRLVTYSGKMIELEPLKNPNLLTKNIINTISKMQYGSEEYENYINTQ
jgi:hypothetical protein